MAEKYTLAHVGNWKHCAFGLGLNARVSLSVCDCVSDHGSNEQKQRQVEVYQMKDMEIPAGMGDGHGWPDLTPEPENECTCHNSVLTCTHLKGVCRSS